MKKTKNPCQPEAKKENKFKRGGRQKKKTRRKKHTIRKERWVKPLKPILIYAGVGENHAGMPALNWWGGVPERVLSNETTTNKKKKEGKEDCHNLGGKNN